LEVGPSKGITVTFQNKRVEFELKWLPVAEPDLRACLVPIGFRCNADDTPRFAAEELSFDTVVGWQFDRPAVTRVASPRDTRFADWADGLRLRAANGLRHREAEASWRRHRTDHAHPALAGRGTAG
jgi:hypothetical protein